MQHDLIFVRRQVVLQVVLGAGQANFLPGDLDNPGHPRGRLWGY